MPLNLHTKKGFKKRVDATISAKPKKALETIKKLKKSRNLRKTKENWEIWDL